MIKAEDLIPYRKKASNYEDTQALILKLQNLKAERKPFYLNLHEFDMILKWKLRTQYKRTKHLRDNKISDGIIKLITYTALNITHDIEEIELEYRINLLCVIPGVGIPVASAILTLCFPEKYGIIDVRVWRVLFSEVKRRVIYFKKPAIPIQENGGRERRYL